MAGSSLGALWLRGGLVLLPGLLAAAVALVLSLLSTPMYRASADVLVDAGDRSIGAEAAVAAGAEIRNDVHQMVGEEPDLSVEAVDGSEVLVFTANSSNAENTAIAANTHASVFVAQSGDRAELIDPATVPSDPYEPDTVRNTLLAFVVGLLIGIVAALVLTRSDSAVRSTRRLQDITGVPNLAVIPRVRLGERRPDDLAATGDPNSIEAEAYRTLRTAVEFLTNESGAKVVLVTSPRPGEGSSSVAANLAVTVARAGRNVVLIDGDLRRPQINRSCGVRNDRGLSSVLAGDDTLSRAVEWPDAEKHLVIVPAGPPPPDPAELLLSDRLGKAIEALAKAADLVVIDAPPVLPATDSMILAQHCDAVLLAVTVGLSDRLEWAETMERLALVEANVIGTVLLRPDSRATPMTTHHNAPTAAPANRWVTQASEAERAEHAEHADVTTVMPRDPVIVEPQLSAAGGRRSRSAIWGTFGTAAALVSAQATSAIALLFLARRTEPEAFGSYIGLYAASLSVGALVDFGSSQYRTRELAKGHERANFRWWLRRRSVMQLPVVVVFGLGAVALIGDRLPMLCTVGLVAQALTYSASLGSMAAVRATRSPVMAEWFVGIGNLVLLVVCVVGPSSVLLTAAGLGAAGSWLLTAIIGLVVTRGLVGGAAPPPEVRNPWAGSTSFGVSSFVTSIGGFAIAAIVWTSGADQAALIGAVNKWGQPIVLFAAAYAGYMFPAFARAPTDRDAFQLLRPLRVIVGLGTLLALGMVVISPWLVDTLLGEAYAGAETILRLTLLAAIPVLVSQPLASFLQARGAERFVATLFVGISVTVFPLSIAGSVVLGAASIPLFSILASSILLVVFGRRALALRGEA